MKHIYTILAVLAFVVVGFSSAHADTSQPVQIISTPMISLGSPILRTKGVSQVTASSTATSSLPFITPAMARAYQEEESCNIRVEIALFFDQSPASWEIRHENDPFATCRAFLATSTIQ